MAMGEASDEGRGEMGGSGAETPGTPGGRRVLAQTKKKKYLRQLTVLLEEIR